jgi:AcrR family transcriptional regulator
MSGRPPVERTPTAGRKVEQILAGARAAFVELGYDGTTVDDIARRAGVSKPTLYSRLGDKRAIFAAVLEREFAAQARAIFPVSVESLPVADGLLAIGRHYIRFLLSAAAQDLFRVAVAEAQRFPELGRAFYESGPGLGAQRLAAYLRGAADRGELAIDDFDLAAHQFTELCRADLFYRRLLLGASADEQEIDRIAAASVRLFLSGYQPASKKRANRR